MTDRSVAAMPPLGVGSIVGESFSLFFGRFPVFFMLAFLPTLISFGISASFFGVGMYSGTMDPETILALMTSVTGVVIMVVLPMIIYGLSTALIVCAAYDAKLGRPARISQYFSIAVTRAVPVVLVSFAVGIMVGLGSMLLIIPGLYLAALFSVAVVVVVLESMWFSSLSRSIALTKEYRWPILGALILLYLVAMVLQWVLGLVAAPLFATLGGLIGILIFAAVGAIGTAILSIGFVLIYARLREIKEGVSVDSLAEVFS